MPWRCNASLRKEKSYGTYTENSKPYLTGVRAKLYAKIMKTLVHVRRDLTALTKMVPVTSEPTAIIVTSFGVIVITRAYSTSWIELIAAGADLQARSSPPTRGRWIRTYPVQSFAGHQYSTGACTALRSWYEEQLTKDWPAPEMDAFTCACYLPGGRQQARTRETYSPGQNPAR